jgi:hypothetical protein
MGVSRRNRFWLSVVAVILVVPAMLLANRWQRADASSINLHAALLTRDVAPGDDVAIALAAHGGLASWLTEVRVRFVSGTAQTQAPFVPVWTNLEDEVSWVRLVLAIPEDARLGPARFEIQADVGLRLKVVREYGTTYYRPTTLIDRIDVPVQVQTPEDRSSGRRLARIWAAAAWLLASVVAYTCGRWGLRGIERKLGRPPVPKSPASWRFLPVVVVLVGLGGVGEWMCVQPILATTLLHLEWSLRGLWCLGIIVGLWWGLGAQSEYIAWMRVRIRAIVGRAKEHSYREASFAPLPSTLSREVQPQPAAQLADVLRELGAEVAVHERGLRIFVDGEPVLRMQAQHAEPWRPEDFDVRVREGVDPTPLVGELVKLYGPLEYKPATGKPVQLEG